MSMGLYDADLFNYHYFTLPNIDLMKISQYYRNQNELVAQPRKFEPERYSSSFYFQDFEGELIEVDKFETYNVQCRGRYFYPDYRIPLPLDIEMTVPSPLIYQKFYAQAAQTGIGADIFKSIAADTSDHLILSLDGSTVWDKWDSQLGKKRTARHVILYDYNLAGIKEVIPAIKQIQNRWRSTHGTWGQTQFRPITSKFPIQLRSIQDIRQWWDLELSPFNEFIIDQKINAAEMMWVTRYLNEVQPQFNKLTYRIQPQEVVYNRLARILPILYHWTLFCKQHRIFLLLIYRADTFVDTEWDEVIQLINRFTYSQLGGTMESYVQKRGTAEDISTLNFVSVESPKLYQQFCQEVIPKVEKGRFKL